MSKEYVYDNNFRKIRLVYVAIEKFDSYIGEKKIGKTYNASSVFAIPDHLDVEKTCKLVSYLSDKIERIHKLEPCSSQSVARVSEELSKYGFKKVEGYDPIGYHATSIYMPIIKLDIGHGKEIEGCVDLFTINGDPRLFRRCNLKNRYFDWYTENIKENEILKIIRKPIR